MLVDFAILDLLKEEIPKIKNDFVEGNSKRYSGTMITKYIEKWKERAKNIERNILSRNIEVTMNAKLDVAKLPLISIVDNDSNENVEYIGNVEDIEFSQEDGILNKIMVVNETKSLPIEINTNNQDYTKMLADIVKLILIYKRHELEANYNFRHQKFRMASFRIEYGNKPQTIFMKQIIFTCETEETVVSEIMKTNAITSFNVENCNE